MERTITSADGHTEHVALRSLTTDYRPSLVVWFASRSTKKIVVHRESHPSPLCTRICILTLHDSWGIIQTVKVPTIYPKGIDCKKDLGVEFSNWEGAI